MIDPHIVAVLYDVFKLPSLRPSQLPIITTILANQDIVAVLPTGGGKSLCFQLPAVIFPGLTIVISPLLSLINDQVTKLSLLGVSAATISSQISLRQKLLTLRNIHHQKTKILYISPEQLHSRKLLRALQPNVISLVVIDEAHCLVEWGNAFRPAYVEICTWLQKLPKRPTVAAFTATATPETINELVLALKLSQPKIITQTAVRSNLHISIVTCQNSTEKALCLMQQLSQSSNFPMIVYCSTRKETEKVAQLIDHFSAKFPKQIHGAVGFYHAGLATEIRIKTEKQFISNQLDVLVATTAFGMGIDKSNIRFICHWQMPASIENFCQEIGRAGRDGKHSASALCYTNSDIKIHQSLLAPLEQKNKTELLNKQKKVFAMYRFCEVKNCLNYEIGTYFGETEVPFFCGHCSNCHDKITLTIQQKTMLIKLKEKIVPTVHSDQLSIPINTLVWLCILQPTETRQLWHVPGMGRGLIEKFGAAIIDEINYMQTTTPMTTDELDFLPLEK